MPFAAVVAAAALAAAQAPPAQQPTFRAGTNLVQVDVVVTSPRGDPVGDLTADDFQVLDDGVPVPIAAFRYVDLSHPDPSDRFPVRTADDEEREAARDDTRLIAILLDDYHIGRFGPNRVIAALVDFVQHLPPTDLVGVYYPLESPRDVRLTYDRRASIAAIQKLQGRSHEYLPKHPVEEEHLRYPRAIERLRTQVVLTGAVSLTAHLGELKIGRKSIILVSEGFTAAGYESGAQTLYDDLREVTESANRNNVSIYPLDPRGLVFDAPGLDPLRLLAADTGGRAMVSRNNFRLALAQIAQESTAYYLLGFVSAHAADGKFHRIAVRSTRRATIKARAGYWALTEAELEASRDPSPEVLPAVVEAFNRLADALRPPDGEARRSPTAELPDGPRHAPLLEGVIVGVVQGRSRFEPVQRPEFTRAQRIAVRAALAPGEVPTLQARLLDRRGRKLADLPVTVVGGSCEVPIPVGSLGLGDYVVQLAAKRLDVTAEQFVALRVSR